MLALLAVGLTVHVRVISLALLAVVLAVGTYCRRFGPRGFMGGMLAFMGAFLGFFIQDYVKSRADFGWLVAEIAIGTAVTIAVHFAFFPPRPEAAVRRMQRSYGARARALASEVAELYEATIRSGESEQNQRAEQRLQRQLLRLNEAALLIDAQLQPGGGAGGLERRRAAPAAVRRGGRAEQRRAVRARARQAAASRAGLRADRGRPERHPRRRPARRVRHRRGHQGAA